MRMILLLIFSFMFNLILCTPREDVIRFIQESRKALKEGKCLIAQSKVIQASEILQKMPDTPFKKKKLEILERLKKSSLAVCRLKK